MAKVTYTEFVNDYLVKDGMLGNAVNLNKAPDQLKKEIDDIYTRVTDTDATLDLIKEIGGSDNVPGTVVIRDEQGNIAVNELVGNLNGTASKGIDVTGGTAGSLLYQSGVNDTDFIAPGTPGYFLQSTGTGAPIWSEVTGGGTGGGGGNIVKPVILTPTDGTTDYTGAVTASYTTSSTYMGTQNYVEWEASLSNTFGTLEDSYSGNSNLLSWTPSISGALTTVYVRTRQGSDNHISEWSEPISFTTPNVYINTPTLTVEGAPNDIGEKPVLTSGAFSVFNGTDTHKSTDWVIEQSGTVVWSSMGDTTNKLSITVPAGYLVESTEYTFKVRHNGATYGSSAYVSVTGTTKSAFFNFDSDFGGFLEGGYYAGKITRADGVYALIVAPKASGQASSLKWKDTNTTSGGCKSLNDGSANTAYLVANGNATTYPAAHFCNNLVINGYSDWYLPARDELEIAYRNLKPTTDANDTRARSKSDYVYTLIDDVSGDTRGVNRHSVPTGAAYTTTNPAQTSLAPFKQGGAESFYVDSDSRHRSSTENSSSGAWYQVFSGVFAGNQYGDNMTNSFLVRAFRAVKVS